MCQREDALAVANERRAARVELRREIRRGNDSIAAAIERRDPRLHGMALIDIIRLGSHGGRTKLTAKQEAMGAAAARQHVNLIITLEHASNKTIWWTLDYIAEYPGVQGNTHGRRMA